jgi:hypothetical protein
MSTQMIGEDRSGNAHLESHLEAYLNQRVRTLGGMTIKMVPVLAGMPDRLVLPPGGGAYFVELKQEKGRVANIQKVRHARLAELGFRVRIINNRLAVAAFLYEAVDTLGPHSGDTARPGKA